MHTTIRQYNVERGRTQEIMQSIQDEFIPLVSAIPGFVAYEALDAGDRLVTISTFDSKEGTEESTKRAAKFLQDRPELGKALSNRQIIEGDADIRSPCLPLNGCGRKREVQSMTFFRTPGIEALYSGDAIMTASAVTSRSRRRCAPAGMPSSVCTSWS